MAEGRLTPPIAGVVWAGVSTGSNTPSSGVWVADAPFCSAFGHVSGACTVTVMYSNDNTTFYASQNKQVLAGASDFAIDFTPGAQYIALQSTANVTATGIISAKG